MTIERDHNRDEGREHVLWQTPAKCAAVPVIGWVKLFVGGRGKCRYSKANWGLGCNGKRSPGDPQSWAASRANITKSHMASPRQFYVGIRRGRKTTNYLTNEEPSFCGIRELGGGGQTIISKQQKNNGKGGKSRIIIFQLRKKSRP